MKNEFREHYTPTPIDTDTPHPLAILGGALVTVAGVYLMTVILFCL